MSRDDGFAVADVDSGYFDDAKMRDLWQRLHDPDLMARAVCLHLSTVLASWRHGERVTVAQSAPLWIVADQGLLDMLHAVGLLDGEYRLSSESWTDWFLPASERRELRRQSGALGGLRAGGQRSHSDALAILQQRSSGTDSDAIPVRPSVRPSYPTVERAQESAPKRTNGVNVTLLIADHNFGRHEAMKQLNCPSCGVAS